MQHIYSIYPLIFFKLNDQCLLAKIIPLEQNHWPRRPPLAQGTAETQTPLINKSTGSLRCQQRCCHVQALVLCLSCCQHRLLQQELLQLSKPIFRGRDQFFTWCLSGAVIHVYSSCVLQWQQWQHYSHWSKWICPPYTSQQRLEKHVAPNTYNFMCILGLLYSLI